MNKNDFFAKTDMNKNNNKNILNGTKAEVLKNLFEIGFPVPKVLHFSVAEWVMNSKILYQTSNQNTMIIKI